MLSILRFLPVVLLCVTLFSCADRNTTPERDSSLAYYVPDSESLIEQHAPVVIVDEKKQSFNRIGTVIAQDSGSGLEVVIDPAKASYYAEERQFTTDNGSYRNLFYRIHFEEVPGSLIPFHLTAGKNGGLYIVITLNSDNDPVLYTSVHTCGCYLAFIPTSHLPEDMRPEGWSISDQSIFGETLPGYLDYGTREDLRFFVHKRTATHRIRNVWLSDLETVKQYESVKADIVPVDSLESITSGDQVISFYETEGKRKGYVRDSQKFWEWLLISWWAFDAEVGEDKKLGKTTDDGPIFYTSLKPWARNASDLRDFPKFLKYWGWKL